MHIRIMQKIIFKNRVFVKRLQFQKKYSMNKSQFNDRTIVFEIFNKIFMIIANFLLIKRFFVFKKFFFFEIVFFYDFYSTLAETRYLKKKNIVTIKFFNAIQFHFFYSTLRFKYLRSKNLLLFSFLFELRLVHRSVI